MEPSALELRLRRERVSRARLRAADTAEPLMVRVTALVAAIACDPDEPLGPAPNYTALLGSIAGQIGCTPAEVQLALTAAQESGLQNRFVKDYLSERT